MSFSPQRRVIFRHRNFKKWSVFCTSSLPNVFLATAGCNFSTSQLRKVVQAWGVLHIFTSKWFFLATAACNFWCLCWTRTSAPAALTGLIFDWPDIPIIEKTQHFATSLTFGADVSSFFWLWRYCIFFLLTWLLYSAFQLSIFSEVRLLNILRLWIHCYTLDIYTCVCATQFHQCLALSVAFCWLWPVTFAEGHQQQHFIDNKNCADAHVSNVLSIGCTQKVSHWLPPSSDRIRSR